MAGYTILLNGGPIATAASRATATPLSSCQGEYLAASKAAVPLVALRDTAEFIGFKMHAPSFIFSDNMAAVQLSDNNTSSKRPKHIATRIAFLQELRNAGAIVMYHIANTGQVGNIFTKPLGAALFHEFRQYLVGGP